MGAGYYNAYLMVIITAEKEEVRRCNRKNEHREKVVCVQRVKTEVNADCFLTWYTVKQRNVRYVT